MDLSVKSLWEVDHFLWLQKYFGDYCSSNAEGLQVTKSEALNKCTHYFWTWLFISEVSMTNIIPEKILCELTSFWSCRWWIHGTPILYEKSFMSARFLYIQSYCLEWTFALEDCPKYLFSKRSSLCSLRLAVEQVSSSCSVRLADSELEKIKMSKDLPRIICWNFNLLTAWMTRFFLFFIVSDYLSVCGMGVGRCEQYYIIVSIPVLKKHLIYRNVRIKPVWGIQCSSKLNFFLLTVRKPFYVENLSWTK